MQPYFVPYAGYFRLFAAADVVVMFDCVQFPRRGWVHRNRMPNAAGELDWLSLPIAKAPRSALISDLVFAPDARARLEALLARFPILERALKARHPLVERILDLGSGPVADYLCGLIRDLAGMLGFDRRILRSSSLSVPPELHGQERVIAIARQLGAARYVNPPGGRELYDAASFAASGIELAFLTPYAGPPDSILARLLAEPAAHLRSEIVRETVLAP